MNLHQTAQRTVEREIVHVTTGTLLMPSLGWNVTSITRQTPTPVMSYLDYPIPPPIHACVEIGISMDQLLFENREFLHGGDCLGRQLTAAEYSELIRDHEDLSDIRVFGDYLKSVHNWKNEMELNAFEDDLDVPLHYLPNGIPHQYTNETSFVLLLSLFTTEIDSALKLRSKLVKHLHPFAHQVDEYIHLPIVGRDETCTEGMLLTNAALMEHLGLLTKATKGRFNLGPNAKQRTVFLYGDALSVNFHN